MEVAFVRKTEKAVLVDIGAVEWWLPLSQVRFVAKNTDFGEGEIITILIKDWLYRKKLEE